MKNFIKLFFVMLFMIFVNKVNALDVYNIKTTTPYTYDIAPFDDGIWNESEGLTIYKNNKEFSKFNIDGEYYYDSFSQKNTIIKNNYLYFPLQTSGDYNSYYGFFRTDLKTLKTEKLIKSEQLFFSKDKNFIAYIDANNSINIINLSTNKTNIYIPKNSADYKNFINVFNGNKIIKSITFSNDSKKLLIVTYTLNLENEKYDNISYVYSFDIKNNKFSLYKKFNYIPNIISWDGANNLKIENKTK